MANISAKQVKELRDITGVGMMDAKKALVEVDGDLDKAIDNLREKGLAKAAKKANRIAAEGLTASYVDGNVASLVEVNSETDFVASNEKFIKLVNDIAQAVAKAQPADLEAANEIQIDGKSIADQVIEATQVIGEKISFRRFAILTKSDNDVFGEYAHQGGRIGVLTVIADSKDEEVAKDVAMHVAAINPKYLNPEDVDAEEVERERTVQRELTLNEGKPENIVDKIVEGRMHKFYSEICLNEQAFVKDGDQTVAKYVASHGGKVAAYVRFEVGEGMEKRSENFAEEVAAQMNN
ncbi:MULTISPECIES: translation elongation factor Ts [Facklamia]|uniref:translation elongation factor Ts n=1 Tax=Facklamia TaxID=66831 RepID=UPI0008A374B1|nr:MULTISPECIES: translation elongation factor Ts [Facklamia]OFL65127.1 elongation factor Ts [Facklamia sp. HMSC062C11]RYC98903.1 elongation factor Ts [Facklamia hominis]WPJ91584.1 translation elongation factor Ts [Facklamia hominis]